MSYLRKKHDLFIKLLFRAMKEPIEKFHGSVVIPAISVFTAKVRFGENHKNETGDGKILWLSASL